MNSKLKTVLVIDGGGRGAVLVDKYLESPHVSRVLVIPGNDLMKENTRVGKTVNIYPKIKTTDISQILEIAKTEKVDLVDVCQDDAIAAGLVDTFLKSGVRAFGPNKLAGRIEWDKAWARDFMKKFEIPIPDYKICQSEKEGIDFVKKQKEGKWFIKASGLAAGKGAIFARNKSEALDAIDQMTNFGKAGKTFLIEQCLDGEEFSSFAIVSGVDFQIIGHAQDHKTLYSGDLGPNTGGMGCCSPPLVITKSIENQIKEIFRKTVEGLSKIGRPYRGILYLGGMIDDGDVKVIEFNARWGDPEAQVIVPAIKNDFYELALATLEGQLNSIKIRKDNFYRVAVTAAVRGYPFDYKEAMGREVFGIDEIKKIKNIKIFGAGVKKSAGKYLVSGGRMFYVVGEGPNVAESRKLAYNALSLAYVEGNFIHFRTDIGWRDLERFYKRGKNG